VASEATLTEIGKKEDQPIYVDIAMVTKDPHILNIEGLDFIPKGRVIIETSAPLGLARKRAIGKVQAKWFAFIDDDVEITETWFSELTHYLGSEIGAIQGSLTVVGLGDPWDRILTEYAHSELRFLKLGDRGFTHNTLIRTELVKDWRPSRPDLSAYEDYEITQHILKKGYRWIVAPTSAMHNHSWGKVAINSIWGMQGWKKSLKPSLAKKLKMVLRLGISPFVILIRTKNLHLFLFNIYAKAFSILGVVLPC
jgi:glycosyltransferase involved in cell wall biosynthesis